MRFGLFCSYHAEEENFSAAYAAQTREILRAEALGFDEAWLAEHHFNPEASSPSIFALLGQLAALTTRIRLGSAAVLLPFRNPLLVAEDVATIDLLSGGRFDFGFAKGAPFGDQNRHFGVTREVSRDMTIEAFELIAKLLGGGTVDFAGKFFSAEAVRLVPRPVQAPVPAWFATTTEDALRYAARKNLGLMAAPPFPVPVVEQMIETFRGEAPGADPKLVIARFFMAAPTRNEAFERAGEFIARFEQKLARGAQNPSAQPGAQKAFDGRDLLARSLIGSYDEVVEQIFELQRRLNPYALLIAPASRIAARREAAILDFAENIRPRLAQAAVVARAG